MCSLENIALPQTPELVVLVRFFQFNQKYFTSSSSFFLHKVMNRIKRQKMRTTNPRRIPATAVTTTSLVPKAEESAPGFVPSMACASFQLHPLTEQHCTLKHFIDQTKIINDGLSPGLCCQGPWTAARCWVTWPAGIWGPHTGWWLGRTGDRCGQRLNMMDIINFWIVKPYSPQNPK